MGASQECFSASSAGQHDGQDVVLAQLQAAAVEDGEPPLLGNEVDGRRIGQLLAAHGNVGGQPDPVVVDVRAVREGVRLGPELDPHDLLVLGSGSEHRRLGAHQQGDHLLATDAFRDFLDSDVIVHDLILSVLRMQHTRPSIILFMFNYVKVAETKTN